MFDGPHAELWGLLCPDCGPGDKDAIAAASLAEITRLRRGDFTPDEFQALCHHRDERPGCTRAEFGAGCREYQRKLFGPGGG